jgi:hypothetical protein
MHLALGSRHYDLATRALVLGALGPPDAMVRQGADLVEACAGFGTASVPICAVALDEAEIDAAVAAGADIIRLPDPTPASLRRCAAAGVAVIVPAPAVDGAYAAGLPPERVVAEPLLLDVTAHDSPVAATAVGVIRGARIVRTADVRGARRICDVLAAILEAR